MSNWPCPLCGKELPEGWMDRDPLAAMRDEDGSLSLASAGRALNKMPKDECPTCKQKL